MTFANLLRAVSAASLAALTGIAHADLADALAQYVGYTIVAVLPVTGFVDTNGKKGDSFEGCEYGRVIVFQGDKALTCTGYGYSYAYRPTALILARGGLFKMIVNGNTYDMRN